MSFDTPKLTGVMFPAVNQVLRTLVHFGAPPNILVDGKPHLGTDRLVPLIRNFRQHLLKLGVRTRCICLLET